MLHIMNAENWIDPRSEMKYQFHQTIDMSCYPQVHDFYELSLVIEGKMNVTVDGWNQGEHVYKHRLSQQACDRYVHIFG